MNKEVTIFHEKNEMNCSNYVQNFMLKMSLNDNKQFTITLPLNFAECPKPIDNKCSQCTFKKGLASNSLNCSSIPTCGLQSNTIYKVNVNKNNSFNVIKPILNLTTPDNVSLNFSSNEMSGQLCESVNMVGLL